MLDDVNWMGSLIYKHTKLLCWAFISSITEVFAQIKNATLTAGWVSYELVVTDSWICSRCKSWLKHNICTCHCYRVIIKSKASRIKEALVEARLLWRSWHGSTNISNQLIAQHQLPSNKASIACRWQKIQY